MTENVANNEPSVISLSVSAVLAGFISFLIMTALPFLGTAVNIKYGWNIHIVHAVLSAIISLLFFVRFYKR